MIYKKNVSYNGSGNTALGVAATSAFGGDVFGVAKAETNTSPPKAI